ncbi:MAG: acyltransferase domain-containing protein, partial [Chloroflexi bacterium]
VVAGDRGGLLAGLRALASGEASAEVCEGRSGSGRAVFVFPGQGGQWAGMGRELLETSVEFAEGLRACGR